MAGKRKDGRLQKSFTVNGKRYFVYAKTRKELDRKEYEKRTEILSAKDGRENPTIDQYFEKWLDAKRGSVKETTILQRSVIHKTFSDVEIDGAGRFGSIRMKDIKPDDIRELQKKLCAKGLHTATVNIAVSLVSQMFRTAVNERQLDYNPCSPVKALKRTEEAARDTTHRALTPEETAAFFKEAEGSYYYNLFLFAINTGMRIGEIAALRVSDIRGGMIHVKRTVTRTEGGGIRIGDSAKTKKGMRTIPVNATVRGIIDRQKAANTMLHGNVVSMDGLLFANARGGLVTAVLVDRSIAGLCKKAGIERFSAHAFRATFATRCIESGMDPRTLQELLGHADFGMTMNLYGHVMEDTKKTAMENISIAV